MKTNQILTIHGTDYTAMTRKLLEKAELAGELPDREMHIGIKPNLVVAKAASSGATTHPDIVAGVIEYLQENGYRNLCVLEGSWVGDRTERAYAASGIGKICKDRKVPYFDLQKDTSQVYDIKGFQVKICDRAAALDYLINLPVVKGHCQTVMTCALKNHKGLIPNSEKRRFHTLGLHAPIAHLSAAFPKEFIVADNICGDLDFEEGGNPVTMNRIYCCKDPVLCDAFACETIGCGISEVPYITMAEHLGVGCSDLSRAEIIALNEGWVENDTVHRSRRVERLAAYTCPREACSACYGALIYALGRLDREGALESGRPPVCIGQGYRGRTGDAIGVGHCTQGCSYSLGGCPPTAAEMIRFLRQNWK